VLATGVEDFLEPSKNCSYRQTNPKPKDGKYSQKANHVVVSLGPALYYQHSMNRNFAVKEMLKQVL
jgi:hypothetical protein